MDNDIETLATALYVKIDDMLRAWPELVPPRPAVGIAPALSDAELVTLAVSLTRFDGHPDNRGMIILSVKAGQPHGVRATGGSSPEQRVGGVARHGVSIARSTFD